MKKETVSNPADGLLRFQLPILELLNLLKQAKSKRGRILFLYQSGARNHLFRLEALSRIYKGIQSKKIFDPLCDEFKSMEDQFGKIDFFDAFLKEFSNLKNIPPAFLKYYTLNRDKEIKTMEGMIATGGILKDEVRLNEIQQQLSGLEWMSRAEERKVIALYLATQIEKLLKQYEDGELHFNDLENGVHEFRRKLRWISIYAQSLNGLIQLKKVKEIPPGLQSYQLPEIISSPFNSLPQVMKGMRPIEIQSTLFYALSWIIQETGKLKDAGLKCKTVNEALKHMDLKSKDAIRQLKSRLLPKASPTLSDIAEKTERIVDTFIHQDRVLTLIRRDILRSLTSL